MLLLIHSPSSLEAPGKQEVPEDWRKASVTSILTKGKEEEAGNCRTASLTSSPGQVGTAHPDSHLKIRGGKAGDEE